VLYFYVSNKKEIRIIIVGKRMNKTKLLFLLFALCLVLLVFSCSKSPQDKIVGEWKGTDNTGETASLVFDEDGNAKMIQGNLVLDGQTLGGKVAWRLDASQDPIHLDLLVTPSSGESRTLPMIVRFITDSKIQLRYAEDMVSRPTGFLPSDNKYQIVLIKQ
jgi:hypothetical protein